MTYGLNDVWLTPAKLSRIEHRSQCDPFIDGNYPLFTAPMNSVVDANNYQVFLDNHIHPIIPRGVDYSVRWNLSTKVFVAVSLDEFEGFVHNLESKDDKKQRFVCIDIANGHMKKLIDLCKSAKQKFGNQLVLMTGNIANPDTYFDYAEAGIDYVRASIGSGNSCITACNTGVYFGQASLIKQLADKKWELMQAIGSAKDLHVDCPFKSIPLIVADGGFSSFDRIIKALALGADYVMVGKLFAQSEEACGEIQTVECLSKEAFLKSNPNLPRNLKWIYDDKKGRYCTSYRLYYGMSTKRAQKETGKVDNLRTSEGIEFYIPVLYSLASWCDNFKSYLQSAMSYTDSFNLEEFKNAKYTIVSQSEYMTFYK